MGTAVLVMAAGYFIGGAAGDWAFRRSPRGRLGVCAVGVLLGAVLLPLNVPLAEQGLFLALLSLTAVFVPFASPNVVATVYDVTLPEVRSTALAVQSFIEESGAALAPVLTGFIAVRASLGDAILMICVAAWLLCAAAFAAAAWVVPADIAALRAQLRARAAALRPAASRD